MEGAKEMSVEGRCRRVANVSGSLRGKDVRRNNPVKYFLPTWVGSTSGVPEGVMAVEVLQNQEIYGGKNGGRKRVGSTICWNWGGMHIKKQEKLLKEMLTPT